jgi:hypothetical protein
MAIRSKRGTEKPIEIFIALFVILAVSLLVLRLFQTQIQGTTDDLSQYQAEQQRSQLKSTFEAECRSICSAAENEKRCSLESIAQVCISNSKRILAGEYIDLNRNNRDDYDTEAYVGIGVCENNIPCFLEQNNCCGRELNAAECGKVLCELAVQRGTTPATDIFTAVGFSAVNYQCADSDDFAWWTSIPTTCATP